MQFRGVYGRKIYISMFQKKLQIICTCLGGFGPMAWSNGVKQGPMWNNGALSYDGVKVVIASGLPDDSMMAAQKSNLYFGTRITF
ncbi:MAG: hypothetical protein CM15mV116_110 [uncultured marine virus]|nr:MAG: hypothetical protein CM15mV116_110 [uncultured marine virus]